METISLTSRETTDLVTSATSLSFLALLSKHSNGFDMTNRWTRKTNQTARDGEKKSYIRDMIQSADREGKKKTREENDWKAKWTESVETSFVVFCFLILKNTFSYWFHRPALTCGKASCARPFEIYWHLILYIDYFYIPKSSLDTSWTEHRHEYCSIAAMPTVLECLEWWRKKSNGFRLSKRRIRAMFILALAILSSYSISH